MIDSHHHVFFSRSFQKMSPISIQAVDFGDFGMDSSIFSICCGPGDQIYYGTTVGIVDKDFAQVASTLKVPYSLVLGAGRRHLVMYTTNQCCAYLVMLWLVKLLLILKWKMAYKIYCKNI